MKLKDLIKFVDGHYEHDLHYRDYFIRITRTDLLDAEYLRYMLMYIDSIHYKPASQYEIENFPISRQCSGC